MTGPCREFDSYRDVIFVFTLHSPLFFFVDCTVSFPQDKPGKGTYQWVEPHILKLPGGAAAAFPREDVALAMVELCDDDGTGFTKHGAKLQAFFQWDHEHSHSIGFFQQGVNEVVLSEVEKEV